MVDIIDIGTWSAGAVIVVGAIQWAKGALSKIALPSWVWAIALPLVSIGAAGASAAKTGDWHRLPWDAAGMWAIAQLGYELIVQTVRRRFGAAPERAE